jgi:hypothetical protein
MHLTRRSATISKKIHEQGGMQKFMDKEECKNSWTRRNAKISKSPYIISAHTASSA